MTQNSDIFFWYTLIVAALGIAPAANAADCLVLSVQLTAYQQDLVEEEVAPSLVKSTIERVKITTQGILNLLAQYHSLTFPSDARICLDGTNETKIVTKPATYCLRPAPPCSRQAAATPSVP